MLIEKALFLEKVGSLSNGFGTVKTLEILHPDPQPLCYECLKCPDLVVVARLARWLWIEVGEQALLGVQKVVGSSLNPGSVWHSQPVCLITGSWSPRLPLSRRASAQALDAVLEARPPNASQVGLYPDHL